MPAGLHHIHKRKRASRHKKIAKKEDVCLEPYPHPEKWKKYLDRALYFVAIVGPFNTIPQIVTIYANKSAEGISTLTFCLLACFTLPWIFYGVVHKEKPIIFSFCLWFLAYIVIITGSILY